MRNLILTADSLLTKWGFDDGDLVKDYLDELHDYAWIPSPISPERDELLHAVVMQYLVPELGRRGIEVEIVRTITCHNPIRATAVSGKRTVDFLMQDDWINPLEGVSVSVKPEEIVELVVKYQTQHKKGDSK